MAKKALLVGINKYKIPNADLRGCVNDVNNIQSMLKDYFGFSARGIKTVTDTRATTKRIREEIQKLLNGAEAGDVLLFHYSGHGANVPDKNGDEADKRDEILCPTDLDWYDPITDDWLRAEFDKVPKGVNLTVIMDCCHSGSNTRDVRDMKAKSLSRFLPCPLDLMAAESGRPLRGKFRSRRRSKTRKTAGRKDVVNVNIPEVLVTGCRDDQTSADAYISGSYNGAMSNGLLRTVKSKKGKLTYRELHTGILQLLKGKYKQVPQLEGQKANFDRQFLAPYSE